MRVADTQKKKKKKTSAQLYLMRVAETQKNKTEKRQHEIAKSRPVEVLCVDIVCMSSHCFFNQTFCLV